MEEIIMTRFLAYKSGFISGKYDFLGSVVTNQAMINVNVSEDSIKEDWFLFGYTDAIEFYEDRFSKGLDIRNIRTNDVVKDLYAKRVTDYNVTNKENVPIKQDIKVMSEDDYTEMLELLRTPIFEQTINTLSIKESAIVALKLGYIDGKCFSDEYIAEFLKIEKTEIKEITKKVLLLYKENLNKFVDHAIETVTEQPRKLFKKIK